MTEKAVAVTPRLNRSASSDTHLSSTDTLFCTEGDAAIVDSPGCWSALIGKDVAFSVEDNIGVLIGGDVVSVDGETLVNWDAVGVNKEETLAMIAGGAIVAINEGASVLFVGDDASVLFAGDLVVVLETLIKDKSPSFSEDPTSGFGTEGGDAALAGIAVVTAGTSDKIVGTTGTRTPGTSIDDTSTAFTAAVFET